MNKLALLLRMLSNVSNPQTYVSHMLGKAGGERVTYRLRNGMSLTLRTRSSDRNVFNDIWLECVYEHPRLRWGEMKTIVDVGAHIGVFTLYAASRAPLATIYAFEPEPANADLLDTNVRQNTLQQRVFTERKGVAGKEGTIRLHVIPGRGEANSAYRQGEQSYSIDVPVTSLENVFRVHPITSCDLLKINCEGEEYDLLYALPPQLFTRIETMLINYHLFSPNPRHHPSRLIPFLEQHGYAVSKHPHEILFAERKPLVPNP